MLTPSPRSSASRIREALAQHPKKLTCRCEVASSSAEQKHRPWEFDPGRSKDLPVTCEFVPSAANFFPSTGYSLRVLRVDSATSGVPSESQDFSSERPEGTSEPIKFASCHRLSILRITPPVGKYREGIHRHRVFRRGAASSFTVFLCRVGALQAGSLAPGEALTPSEQLASLSEFACGDPCSLPRYGNSLP